MQEVRIYTSDSGVSRPIGLVKDIFEGFREGRFLAKQLFVRDLKASVRQSLLGFFWHFVPAIATAIIWIILNSQKVITLNDLPMEYPAFALTGTILWSLFTEAVNKPLNRYNGAKSIMVKLNFPREAILLTAVYDILFSLLLKLIVLIPALVIIGYYPSYNWILGIVGIIPMILLGVGLGVLLVPMGMIYTDVKKGIGLVFQTMMYLSPVIFPFQKEGVMGLIHRWNPISPYIEFIRSNLGSYEFTLSFQYFIWFVLSLIVLIIGLIILKLSLPAILERSGS